MKLIFLPNKEASKQLSCFKLNTFFPKNMDQKKLFAANQMLNYATKRFADLLLKSTNKCRTKSKTPTLTHRQNLQSFKPHFSA